MICLPSISCPSSPVAISAYQPGAVINGFSGDFVADTPLANTVNEGLDVIIGGIDEDTVELLLQGTVLAGCFLLQALESFFRNIADEDIGHRWLLFLNA